jgi:hypothetical protein
MEPQVSEPMAKGTKPAQTADPAPLDEPPLHRVKSQGFMPGPVNEAFGCRYPIPPANSTIANLATRIAPASLNLRMTVAS